MKGQTVPQPGAWCHGYYYIDAFAGTGISELRTSSISDSAPLLDLVEGYSEDHENEEFLDGSALVSIQIENPFTGYVFIEKNPDRAAKLAHSVKGLEISPKRVRIYQQDAISVLRERVLNSPAVDWRRHRAVVFLDPFAMQVSWEIIEALAATKAIEVIINFPLGMGIRRLLHRNPKLPRNRKDYLNHYFGSPEWYDIVYASSGNLFGEETPTKVPDAEKKLAVWYRKRLKSVFGYATAPRLIRNTKGSHLYCLYWAGPNATGYKIADHIMNMGETM